MEKEQKNTDKLSEFITTENLSLYDILSDENVLGIENLELEFGVSNVEDGEKQLQSKFLDESSNVIAALSEFSSEIRESSIPLYSGFSSFESFTYEFDLHLITLEDNLILLSYSSGDGTRIEFFNELEDSLELCSICLTNHIDYIEVELSNYRENKSYYDDSASVGYGMSLNLEWNFPLPDYLLGKEIISREYLSEIKTIEERIESF
jgi:hypothetical protein